MKPIEPKSLKLMISKWRICSKIKSNDLSCQNMTISKEFSPMKNLISVQMKIVTNIECLIFPGWMLSDDNLEIENVKVNLVIIIIINILIMYSLNRFSVITDSKAFSFTHQQCLCLWQSNRFHFPDDLNSLAFRKYTLQKIIPLSKLLSSNWFLNFLKKKKSERLIWIW